MKSILGRIKLAINNSFFITYSAIDYDEARLQAIPPPEDAATRRRRGPRGLRDAGKRSSRRRQEYDDFDDEYQGNVG